MISLIQYESFYPFVFITSWLIWTQIIMWNIIEPKFMWNRLNLSPLAIIVSLSFWWALWWVTWMLLSVPIMVIINIILAKIPATKPIAILLSEKWELRIDSEEEIIKIRKKILHKIKTKILK
jgi:predicted PurR-regulated permease PerM